MSDFIQNCNRISQLDKEATDDLLDKLKTKTFQKGDFLLNENEICRHLYYIDIGLTKTFFFKNDKEFIMRFFSENIIFSVLESYATQTPTKFMIVALETTAVTYIRYEDMEELCRNHHCIETLFRKLVTNASVNMMKRISILLEEDAKARYNHFINENPNLLQRISLGDLANYLGVTQVTLSRIRAKK